MEQFWSIPESLLGLDLEEVINPGILQPKTTNLEVTRNCKYGIEIKTSARFDPTYDTETNPPIGAVEIANGIFEFSTESYSIQCNGVSIFDGVNRTVGDQFITDIISQVANIEIESKEEIESKYSVEWCVANNSLSLLPHKFKIGLKNLNRLVLDDERGQISFAIRDNQVASISRSLGLLLEDTHLYLVKKEIDNRHCILAIVYEGTPDKSLRDKIRFSLSFILGAHISMIASSDVDQELNVAKAVLYSPYHLNNLVISAPSNPPAPLLDNNGFYEPNKIEVLVTSLIEIYDDIDFLNLYWDYTTARSLPFNLAVVFFGAATEALQENLLNHIDNKVGSKIAETKRFRDLKNRIMRCASELDWSEGELDLLDRTINNRAPQSEKSRRFLASLGLEYSDLERESWQRRNDSAHGNPLNEEEIIPFIRESKVLRGIFHRSILKILGHDYYIDYYNTGHPVKDVREPH